VALRPVVVTIVTVTVKGMGAVGVLVWPSWVPRIASCDRVADMGLLRTVAPAALLTAQPYLHICRNKTHVQSLCMSYAWCVHI
jgi:hypothetical protein